MNLNLKGKNAFVGGSSKGIGWATAMELAILGANVTLVSRSGNSLVSKLALLPNDGLILRKKLIPLKNNIIL